MNLMMIYGRDLRKRPVLQNQMFRDRRAKFRDELGWDLRVDEAGREVDEYDELNPLYIILQDARGRHVGSTRLMPTTGRTMIAEQFAHLTRGVVISSDSTWEITRFFVRERRDRRLAPALMWAGCEFALRQGVSSYVGVVSAPMIRVFGILGARPEILGRAESPEGEICACVWELSMALAGAFRCAAEIAPEAAPPEPVKSYSHEFVRIGTQATPASALSSAAGQLDVQVTPASSIQDHVAA